MILKEDYFRVKEKNFSELKLYCPTQTCRKVLAVCDIEARTKDQHVHTKSFKGAVLNNTIGLWSYNF